MSTISKERTQEIFLGNGPEPTASEEHELARIALASLEAEPVAYVDPFAFNNFSVYRAGETDNKRMGREWMWANPGAGLIPVYTATPAPVVMDENQSRVLFEKWCSVNIERNKWHPEHYAHLPAREQWAAWEACRAAMLQGAENAESTTAMQTAPDLDSSPKNAESRGSNSPVIPDSWVACSDRLPPEGYEPDGGAVCYLVWHKNEVDCGPQYSISNVFFLRKHWEKNFTHWMPLPAAPQQEAE